MPNVCSNPCSSWLATDPVQSSCWVRDAPLTGKQPAWPRLKGQKSEVIPQGPSDICSQSKKQSRKRLHFWIWWGNRQICRIAVQLRSNLLLRRASLWCQWEISMGRRLHQGEHRHKSEDSIANKVAVNNWGALLLPCKILLCQNYFLKLWSLNLQRIIHS